MKEASEFFRGFFLFYIYLMNRIFFGIMVLFSCAKGPNYVNNRNIEQRMNMVRKEGKRMQRSMERTRRRASRENSGIRIDIKKNRKRYI